MFWLHLHQRVCQFWLDLLSPPVRRPVPVRSAEIIPFRRRR